MLAPTLRELRPAIPGAPAVVSCQVMLVTDCDFMEDFTETGVGMDADGDRPLILVCFIMGNPIVRSLGLPGG